MDYKHIIVSIARVACLRFVAGSAGLPCRSVPISC